MNVSTIFKFVYSYITRITHELFHCFLRLCVHLISEVLVQTQLSKIIGVGNLLWLDVTLS